MKKELEIVSWFNLDYVLLSDYKKCKKQTAQKINEWLIKNNTAKDPDLFLVLSPEKRNEFNEKWLK